MLLRSRIAQLHRVANVSQRWHGRKTLRWRPRFNACPAPGRIDQAHWHTQLFMEFAPEIITRRREPAPTAICHGLRRAHLPLRVDVRLRIGRPAVGHHQQADTRVIRRRNLLLAVLAGADAHLHIRLPGADPHFTNEYIRERQLVRAGNRHHMRASCLHRRQHRDPLSALIRLGFPFLRSDLDRHLLLGTRPSPHHDRSVPLQHHVVAEHVRNPYVRPTRQG